VKPLLNTGFTRYTARNFGLAGFTSTEIGMSFSNHDFIDDRQERYGRRCVLPSGIHSNFLITLLKTRPVAVSAAIMRHEVWNQIRPLPDILTADLWMHARIDANGWSFVYLHEVLMSYRVHAGQLSQSKTKFRDDGVTLWELLEFDSKEAESLRKRALTRALVSRAGAHLLRNEVHDARNDLSRASKAHNTAILRPRAFGIAALTFGPKPWSIYCGLGRVLVRGPLRSEISPRLFARSTT